MNVKRKRWTSYEIRFAMETVMYWIGITAALIIVIAIAAGFVAMAIQLWRELLA